MNVDFWDTLDISNNGTTNAPSTKTHILIRFFFFFYTFGRHFVDGNKISRRSPGYPQCERGRKGLKLPHIPV